jgi:hypothetical protein
VKELLGNDRFYWEMDAVLELVELKGWRGNDENAEELRLGRGWFGIGNVREELVLWRKERSGKLVDKVRGKSIENADEDSCKLGRVFWGEV